VALLDPSHPLGIGVIVRERLVDSRDFQVVPLGDSIRGEAPLFDADMHISDGDATPFDVGFPVECRVLGGDDSVLLDRYY
jgi:hypothetical protein